MSHVAHPMLHICRFFLACQQPAVFTCCLLVLAYMVESRLKQYLFCQVRCALHSGKPKPNGMQGDFQKSLSLFNIADLQLFRHEGFIVFFRNSVYLVFCFFLFWSNLFKCAGCLVIFGSYSNSLDNLVPLILQFL